MTFAEAWRKSRCGKATISVQGMQLVAVGQEVQDPVYCDELPGGAWQALPIHPPTGGFPPGHVKIVAWGVLAPQVPAIIEQAVLTWDPREFTDGWEPCCRRFPSQGAASLN